MSNTEISVLVDLITKLRKQGNEPIGIICLSEKGFTICTMSASCEDHLNSLQAGIDAFKILNNMELGTEKTIKETTKNIFKQSSN